ncbi:hypothetical protein Salat_2413000 [Sesamum alatum]|uniref:Uncharacterized protein n=1 Tax=Sesamum alatum TaxID=300844 RepID=A0AAE1XYP1_9LAMI|nr:hypothetical protein Salat_2413000 [Sesamum alatum]
MSFTNWKSSRSKSVRLGRQTYVQPEDETSHKWLMFWRRIKRAKKKSSEPALALQKTSYDPHSYLQNFDEGSGRVEPDNLYRSFSARYANPSILYHRKDLMD